MNIPSQSELLTMIEAFLVEKNMAPSRFGRESTGEADLVFTIRGGRNLTLKTAERVVQFMEEYIAPADDASGKSPDVTASQQLPENEAA